MPPMATALSIFAATFAAFCVWLTVRIVNRKERWALRERVDRRKWRVEEGAME
ncbi:MAG: hypothetical protein HY296_04880 [Thaumarchaeota archaeon]|nr:hypothetical protein [Nitrososphaerota archaeon]